MSRARQLVLLAYITTLLVVLALPGPAWGKGEAAAATATTALPGEALDHEGLAASPARTGQESAFWVTERVDAPRMFDQMGGRSLALDAAGHPHIAYGSDFLYYAWHDGMDWHISTVDDAGGVGNFTSLALDGSGYPHISYHDWVNEDLKYAYQDAGGWHVSTVDSTGEVGDYTSLALDSSGYPRISYYDYLAGDLKYAYQDAAGWHVSTLDSTRNVGLCSSLAVDRSGYSHISYLDYSPNHQLKYAYQDASGWHISIVDAANDAGFYTSLALDSSGFPHISYGDAAGLKYAYQDAAGWHIAAVDGSVGIGRGTSLALDASEYPHISYQHYNNGDLKYAYQDAAGWHISTVDSAGYTGLYSSVAMDKSGYPHISYRDQNDDLLKYAYEDAAGWHIEIVDSANAVGGHTSLAVDAVGYPHIGYYDFGNFDLKYAYQDAAGWHISTLDSAGNAGEGESLVLDSSGYPHISYRSNSQLEYAYQDAAGWHFTIVDSSGFVGSYTSLVLDPSGYAHISYYDLTRKFLRYAHQDAAGWHLATVDDAASVGQHNSLALDSYSYAHVSYYDATNGDLKYAYQDAAGWHVSTLDSAGNVGEYTSLALDDVGYAHISYYDRSSHLLKYAYEDAAGWHIAVLDSTPDVGRYSSLVLDGAGYPHVSYCRWDAWEIRCAELKYAYQDAAGWHIAVADNAGYVGAFSSLVLDGLGAPHISYMDESAGDLKYAYECTSLSAVTIAGPNWLPVGQTGLYSATTLPITASRPLLTWDNGTVGPSAPYSWTLPGSYTVTVTATNGCSAVGGTLAVTVCQPAEEVTVQGPAFLLVGETGLYSATYSPPTATQPLTITWDNGAVGPSAPYSWPLPGRYAVTATASSRCGEMSGTLAVTVCQPVEGVTVQGPTWLPVGQTGLYSASYFPPTATLPVTFTWNNGTIGPGATYAWTVLGPQTIAASATNECGQVSDTLQVEVCQPLEGVAISGPARLLAEENGLYTATFAPPTATLPVTFTWDNGTVGPHAAYSWPVPGRYGLAVTATSPCGAEQVATHSVAVCLGAQNASFFWTPLTPTIGQWVAFHGLSDGSTPTAYTWDFGDGWHGSGANVSHRYTAAGDYTVWLTATNCWGEGLDTVSHTLTVLPEPCQAAAILSVTAAISGCRVTFGAELRGDAPFAYLWDLGPFGTYAEAGPVVDFQSSGTYSGTLSVWNCGRPAPAVQPFGVAVACLGRYFVYLPIVGRAHR